jgi:hypothetical protein
VEIFQMSRFQKHTRCVKSIAEIAAIFVAVASSTLLAQWPPYTPAAVLKGADGNVDVDGAVPRAADGKPDLSGVWGIVPCIDCPARGGRGAAAPAGQGRGSDATPAAQGRGDAAVAAGRGRGAGGNGQAGGGGRASMGNIGGDLPGGAPYQPWAADLVKQRMANNSKDNPDANCLPMGMAQMNAHPFPRKIIQTTNEVVLIYEGSGTTVREVFLDGRTLPKDPEPWWNGYSVGRWEGDTLVIETTGFMDDGWLDVRGSPLTSSGKIIERFHRVKYGYLELEETIDDAKAYTKPFTAKLYYRLRPETQLIEFVCLDKDAKHYVGASPAK